MKIDIPLPQVDRSCPVVPPEVLALLDPLDMGAVGFYDRLPIFWQEVWDELCDTEYSSRAHHNVGTYDKGCRGPLCTKALREHPKRRSPNATMTPRDERVFDPVLEFFHTVAKHRVRRYKRELLERLSV